MLSALLYSTDWGGHLVQSSEAKFHTDRLSYRRREVPRALNDLPQELTYRSPPGRLREEVGEYYNPIIEVSDDESSTGSSIEPPRARHGRAADRSTTDVISISSASEADADVSELDVAVIPRLAYKRSHTPSSSMGGSPQSASRNRGKRRATPADPPCNDGRRG